MSIFEMNAIDRKIADTEEQLRNLSGATDIYAEVDKRQLNERLRLLLEERESLTSSQNVDRVSLRIYGENVNKGKVSNRVLIAMLDGFQSMADNVASAIISPSTRGKIPNSIMSITDFQVVGVFDGSFGINLERYQAETEMQASTSAVGVILNELFLIMETSANDERLLEEIAPLGARTINKYLEWMNSIKEYNVGLEVNWIDRAAEVRKLHFTPAMTNNIISTLENINDMAQTDVVICGKLTGINIRQSSFEMLDENGKIIKGKGMLDTLIDASRRIGDDISASLVKSTYNSRAKIPNVSWFLSGLM